jgi:hypothetical protein
MREVEGEGTDTDGEGLDLHDVLDDIGLGYTWTEHTGHIHSSSPFPS